MIKRIILALFLISTLVNAGTEDDLDRMTKDGYLLNPITSLPIKTRVIVLDREVVNKIKLTKKKSYFNEIFDLSRKAIYVPNETGLKDDKVLNGVVLFIFKGWVGEDLKAWIRAAVPFKNNKPDDKVFSYHPNGNVEMEINYSNGKRSGLMKDQGNDGKLLMEITYDKGVMLSRIKYYKSGALNEHLLFDNGKLSAVKFYTEDGAIKYEKNYDKQ